MKTACVVGSHSQSVHRSPIAHWWKRSCDPFSFCLLRLLINFAIPRSRSEPRLLAFRITIIITHTG